MTLQGHADVKVTVTEAKTIFGGTKQAELSFICGVTAQFQSNLHLGRTLNYIHVHYVYILKNSLSAAIVIADV